MASSVILTSRKLPRVVLQLSANRVFANNYGVNRQFRTCQRERLLLQVNEFQANISISSQSKNKCLPANLNSIRPFHLSFTALDVIKVPPFADSVSEVQVDQNVMEIETDKTTVGVPTPVSGVIEEIYVADGDTVKAGQQLFKIKAGPVPPADYSREITGTRTEQRVKMNRMRQKIASRLKDAQNTNAMLTTFNEIDMRTFTIQKLHLCIQTHLDAFVKKYGIKLGFMSVFSKAAAYALQDQPVVNAVIDGQEIVYRDYVDISVAVATPKGLVVPVIRNVESKNYADIEIALAALGEKAKRGAIAVEDMDGGTFTISNGGVFGSLMGTPIINPPQSAILGMHGIFDRPIAVKGQVVVRPMMYVALTYDHRLVDGREAVMFLRKIKDAVEDPRIVLAGL
ncbi:Dihydrolipoyllysine-residue succinyltransferase component of 2-oxoglutarate dehydrogenase complex, mitochondrial, partial [Pseudolycoriella hygida]